MESSDGFVGTWEDVRLLCALRRKNNYAKRVEITHLERLPHEIVFEIAKHHPLLIPPLKNRRLRRAVRNYLAGGEKKEKITAKYGKISNWDVSQVTDLSWLFYKATYFNEPLDDWDVSKVLTTKGMFCDAISFNKPLKKWNVSKVVNMNWMFCGALSFNQELGDWDVSKVFMMVSMVQEAAAFNQPLTYWKILNVNVEGMEGMFHGAILFDHRRNAPWWEGTSLVELAKTNPKLFARKKTLMRWNKYIHLRTDVLMITRPKYVRCFLPKPGSLLV